MIKYGKKINGIEAAVPALVDVLSRRTDVQAIYMFGSRAAGTADDLSDVDVAILYRGGRVPVETELDLLDVITSALQTDEVSLVILNNAPLTIAYGVIKGARVLYSRDDRRRLDFEETVMRKYFDFKHYLDSYDTEFPSFIRCSNVR